MMDKFIKQIILNTRLITIRYRGVIFRELHKIYPTHACKQYLENWPQLVKYCGYRYSLKKSIFNREIDVQYHFTSHFNNLVAERITFRNCVTSATI